jgi:hypothetical protein
MPSSSTIADNVRERLGVGSGNLSTTA